MRHIITLARFHAWRERRVQVQGASLERCAVEASNPEYDFPHVPASVSQGCVPQEVNKTVAHPRVGLEVWEWVGFGAERVGEQEFDRYVCAGRGGLGGLGGQKGV